MLTIAGAASTLAAISLNILCIYIHIYLYLSTYNNNNNKNLKNCLPPPPPGRTLVTYVESYINNIPWRKLVFPTFSLPPAPITNAHHPPLPSREKSRKEMTGREGEGDVSYLLVYMYLYLWSTLYVHTCMYKTYVDW